MRGSIKPLSVSEAREKGRSFSHSDDISDAIGTEQDARKHSDIGAHVLPILLRIVIPCVVMLFVLALGAAYVHNVRYYSSHFYPHTMINGVDVSDMTLDEVKPLVLSEAYSLTLHLKYGDVKLDYRDLGFSTYLRPSLDELLQRQDGWLWFFKKGDRHELSTEVFVQYDAEEVARVVRLRVENLIQQQVSHTASISFQDDGTLVYSVESYEDLSSYSALSDAVMRALDEHRSDLDWTDGSYYASFVSDAGDDNLRRVTQVWNKLVSKGLTYKHGKKDALALSGMELASHMRLCNDNQSIEINKGYLVSVFCDYSGFSPTDKLADGVPAEDIEAYLSDVVNCMVSNLDSDEPVSLPRFVLSALTSIDQWALRISMSKKTAELYYDGAIDSTYNLTLSNKTSWKTYSAAVVSATVVDGGFDLSNGLTIRSTVDDSDIGIINLAVLQKRLNGLPLAYVVFISSGSTESAAWNNMMVVREADSDEALPDWSEDWIRVY